jgi:hypothetical protein
MKYQLISRYLRRKLNKKSPNYTAGMLTIKNTMFSAIKNKQTNICRRITAHPYPVRNVVSEPVDRICISKIPLHQYYSLFHRITGVLGVSHRPVFLVEETRRFGNWIWFRPQVNTGRCKKSKIPVILCVIIHHRPNPLNSTFSFAHKITERTRVMVGIPVSLYLDFLVHSRPKIQLSRGSFLLLIYTCYFKLCYDLGFDTLIKRIGTILSFGKYHLVVRRKSIDVSD